MAKVEPGPPNFPGFDTLTKEERKSVTHSEFWIPEDEREKYKVALAALNEAGVPFVVAGAYAIYEHTGIYRQTKDLDLFLTPEAVVQAMRVLRNAGFTTRLEQPHWIGKAISKANRDHFIDIIYGMGNGLALIDDDWFRYSTPAILAATPVRVAPVEELIWHRLFIHERHRHDMADVAHLILDKGHVMDWTRLLVKAGEDWPLLLSQILLFRYVYPGDREKVPEVVLNELLDRAKNGSHQRSDDGDVDNVTNGTMISRFSFAIDVNEGGKRDIREESIARMQQHPEILKLLEADVWDERAPDTEQEIVPDSLGVEE
ncbi:nucleotidyltransferase [Longimicrobium sp.]|jgi:hypothetical protein|uniref:nucleotidyltransferase n=1 Tax=Longimicrobium sp. TaxID=2029185 RepID=UPI002EDA6D32